jgi:hypothetical protein
MTFPPLSWYWVGQLALPSFIGVTEGNTDLSSAELVLGGVGGREGKKARETRQRKTAGTAITYR